MLPLVAQWTIEMTPNRDVLHFKERGIIVPIKSKKSTMSGDEHVDIILNSVLHVPLYSEMEIMGAIPRYAAGKTWIVEVEKGSRNAAMIASAIVEPLDKQVPVRLLNLREDPIRISKGKKIASMELPIEAVITEKSEKVLQVTDSQRQNLWELINKSRERLNPEEQEELYTLLLQYHDLFAKEPNDFGRTDKITHKFDTGESPPIHQSLRRIPPFQRNQAKKLLDGMIKKRCHSAVK